MFYDYSKLLSYNALLNFVIGERGVGKSFGAKKFVITDYLKNGNEFVYILFCCVERTHPAHLVGGLIPYIKVVFFWGKSIYKFC